MYADVEYMCKTALSVLYIVNSTHLQRMKIVLRGESDVRRQYVPVYHVTPYPPHQHSDSTGRRYGSCCAMAYIGCAAPILAALLIRLIKCSSRTNTHCTVYGTRNRITRMSTVRVRVIYYRTYSRTGISYSYEYECCIARIIVLVGSARPPTAQRPILYVG